MIGNYFWGGGGVTSYQIEQSLRFDGTGRLSRSMGAGSRTTATISCWIKSDFYRTFFIDAAGGSSNSLETSIYMSTSSIGVGRYDSSWGQVNGSNRDPAAWYHVMWVLDTNNSTGSDRIRVYVNGVRRTFSFSTTPSQGENLGWNNSAPVYIGHRQQIPDSSGDYYWGYLAEMHHVDGTALDPTDFGEFDDNGVWRPIEVSGLTYSTNGFYLKFDPSATNGIGHDHSGEGNHFTPTGFTTSGTGTDVMDDTPTKNWCTLNPLDKGSSITLSNGNLDYSQYNTSAYEAVKSTFAMGSGKWYWEVYISNRSDTFHSRPNIGILTAEDVTNNYIGSSATGYSYFISAGNAADSNKVNNGSFDSLGTGGYGTGDTVMFAFDNVNGNLWFGKNGTWLLSGNPATSSNPMFSSIPYKQYLAAISSWSSNFATTACTLNAGQRDFTYTPPTGFKALNTSNLSAPAIKDGSKNFNTVLYTGNQSTQSITGVGFQPDLVWVKKRNGFQDHEIQDAVRGATKSLSTSNITAAETTDSQSITSFTSDGFNIGSSNSVNENRLYVAWNWKANGSGSSNTDGTITSTVSANPTAGFSIVSYTGNGTAGATVGHGLGVTPKFIVVKQRSSSTVNKNWCVYHTALGNTKALLLNADAVQATTSDCWNDSGPSSSTFTLGPGADAYATQTNVDTKDYIAYCFAEVEGYSKISEFTGNGVTDGSFVYCGFKPSWILLRRYAASRNWYLYDAARNTFNVVGNVLYPDLANSEASADALDILSNGFKMRTTNTSTNGSGDKILFVAFASNPFGGSGVSPATAR